MHRASTDLERLLRTPIRDVRAFADKARGVLRQRNDLPRDAWRSVYERGVSAAIAQRDLDGVAAMVSLATSRLDSESRVGEAIAHLNLGLGLAAEEPDITLLLLSQRAPLEAAAGDLDAALHTVELATNVAARAVSERPLLEYETGRSVIASIALLPEARPEAAAAVGRLHAAGASSQTALLLSWYIPYLVAAADLDEAAAWTTMLEQIAQRAGHPWRVADAAVFRRSMRQAVEPGRDLRAREEVAEKNWLARWRRAALELHAALLTPDLEEAQQVLTELSALDTDASLAVRDGAAGFAALVAAYRHEPVDLPLPRHVSLQNLGAVYASMEAVALGGSSVVASAWLRWSEAIPDFVTTAVEWPVCRMRVTGLLRARAGDLRGARTDLRRAIEWADARHYVFERGLARAQLAEVMAAGQTDTDRRTEQRLHEEGWAELRSLGVDPVPHAYAASRAASAGLGENARPALSRREAEVLARLARGRTYKEAAAELGISWRTVQNLAYRAYQKLGADGRVQAIQVAREHGLI